MEKRVFVSSISFWFAVEDAGLDVNDVARLMVEVPKTTELVSTIVEKGNKTFVFTNFGSHIDCLVLCLFFLPVEGVRTVTLYRLVK